MDIVEFAEKHMNIELLEYQKEFLRVLEKVGPNTDIRIVTGRKGQSYIYPDQNAIKELIRNGKTANSSQQMSIVR